MQCKPGKVYRVLRFTELWKLYATKPGVLLPAVIFVIIIMICIVIIIPVAITININYYIELMYNIWTRLW